VWTGSSAADVSFKQNIRPSEFETRQPLTTFQSSFTSSTLEGTMTGSSVIPRGKRPGELPNAIGLWMGERRSSEKEGE